MRFSFALVTIMNGLLKLGTEVTHRVSYLRLGKDSHRLRACVQLGPSWAFFVHQDPHTLARPIEPSWGHELTALHAISDPQLPRIFDFPPSSSTNPPNWPTKSQTKSHNHYKFTMHRKQCKLLWANMCDALNRVNEVGPSLLAHGCQLGQ